MSASARTRSMPGLTVDLTDEGFLGQIYVRRLSLRGGLALRGRIWALSNTT